ncbi:hypothetical protein M758_9G056500 [Ceratodon purpureus]|nr:hypothetical protein M758_9G056500 [Ceratodon purpureus]
MDASGTLLGTFESSCLAGASGAAAADLAGDDEQAIISDPFSSTPASDTGGQPNKRRGSPPVGRNEKRNKNLSNGGDQISNEVHRVVL